MAQSSRPFQTALVNVCLLAAGGLFVAQSASAAPMTSANQPPVISNLGVKAGIDRESRESYEVALAFSLICPENQPLSVSVSFTDANGENTERLGKPCEGEWANNPTVPPEPLTEWSVMAFGGLALPEGFSSPPYVLFSPPPGAQGEHPFLYQVKDASGVIAQAPITAVSTPEQRINEGSAAFQEDCVAKGEVKRTASGSGYCIIVGSTSYYAGWPAAPPPPPVPAPSSSPAPKVPPNKPGLYVTPRSRTRKIAIHVSGDGKHVVGIRIKTTVQCQHGYSYEVEDSWLSYQEDELISNHVARVTLETPATRYVHAGSVGVYLQFNGSGGVVGRLRVRLRAKNRKAGLCYAHTIKFTAHT